jgi:hypothetical protein
MERAKAGKFDASMAPRFYRRVQALRRLADYYERALIRHLKYEQGMTWQQVADAVDANLGSRQAAQGKWKRLLDDNRRTPGGPGRGGAPRLRVVHDNQ